MRYYRKTIRRAYGTIPNTIGEARLSKMSSGNEFSSGGNEQGAGVGDADVRTDGETFSQYQMRGPMFQPTVTVRQLRSKGLSFQLWPAANAVCWYLENKFGSEGMWFPGSQFDACPSVLRTAVGRVETLSSVLDGDLALGDNFTSGIKTDFDVVDRICSVIGRAAALGVSFEPIGTQTKKSNDRSEVQVMKSIERPPATREIGTRMDLTHPNSEPNGTQTKISGELQALDDTNSREIGTRVDLTHPNSDPNGTKTKNSGELQALDDTNTAPSVCTEAGNDHPAVRRRMRVLELGSGTGMVGIVAACLGAHVVLTDLPHVVPNVSYNLDLNRGIIDAAGGSAQAKVLRWGMEDDMKALGGISFDLILASDCVYNDTTYKSLLQTLQWLMAADRDQAIASKEQRRPKILLPVGVRIDFSPRILRSAAVCSPPLANSLTPFADTIHPDLELKGNLNGKQPVSQIQSTGRSLSKPAVGVDLSKRGHGSGHDCVILLGHLRRWKKDSQFFRMASKRFDVHAVHRHPPEENARIGPIVYRLSTKSNRKSSSSSSLSSNINSSSGSSPRQ